MDIDFSKLHLKAPHNYAPMYFKHTIETNTYNFLTDFERLVFEDSFEELFNYHEEKIRIELTERAERDFPKLFSKPYDIGFLLEQILREDVDNKDLLLYFKYQLIAFFKAYKITASEAKNFIAHTAKEDLYVGDFLPTRMTIIARLYIDCKEVLQYVELLQEKEPGCRVGIPRYNSGNDIFNFFCGLSFGNFDYSNYAMFSTFAFLIRQSVELRIRYALGIVDVMNDKKSAKIKDGVLFGFFCGNDNINFPRNITKSILAKIFTWANFHIHKGGVLYLWQSILIREYLTPLFLLGETPEQISIYGAVSMSEQYYKNGLKTDLENCLRSNGIDFTNIIFRDRPECMLTR